MISTLKGPKYLRERWYVKTMQKLFRLRRGSLPTSNRFNRTSPILKIIVEFSHFMDGIKVGENSVKFVNFNLRQIEDYEAIEETCQSPSTYLN